MKYCMKKSLNQSVRPIAQKGRERQSPSFKGHYKTNNMKVRKPFKMKKVASNNDLRNKKIKQNPQNVNLQNLKKIKDS